MGWITDDEGVSILASRSYRQLATALSLLQHNFWCHSVYEKMDEPIHAFVLASSRADRDRYYLSLEGTPGTRSKATFSEIPW